MSAGTSISREATEMAGLTRSDLGANVLEGATRDEERYPKQLGPVSGDDVVLNEPHELSNNLDGLSINLTKDSPGKQKTHLKTPSKAPLINTSGSASFNITGMLQPPENFANVAGLIYRSSFPRPENFSFLKRLRLKSIVVLIPEPYPQENMDFLHSNNIQFHQVPISGNKEPFINIPQEAITEIMKIVLNPDNQPLLIHCNRGKHRTGCLVGCIRKLQNWSLTMIFDEYRRFAQPKVRSLDQQFIELYEDSEIVNLALQKNWLPVSW